MRRADRYAAARRVERYAARRGIERYAASLARRSAGHRGSVCLLWLAVLLVGGAVVAGGGLGRLDQSFTASGQAGSRANTAITERYGSGAGVAPLVAVVSWPGGTDGRSPGAAARLASGLSAATAPGTRVLSYADTRDAAFLSRDGRTTYALVYPRSGKPDLAGLAVVREATERLRTGLRAALPDARVDVTGVLPLQDDSAATGPGAGLQLMRLSCVLAALALLWRAFRMPLALVPVLVTAVSSVAALLVVVALAGVVELSFVVVYLIPVAALALSLRRSWLLVSAWRAELARGGDAQSAPRRAGAVLAGPATTGALAGGAALLSLALFPVPFLRSIGLAGAVVCATATLASLTLGPALLAWLPAGRLAREREFAARHVRTRLRPGARGSAGGSPHPRLRRLSAVGLLLALGLLTGAAGFLTTGNPHAEALVRSGPARDGLDRLTAAGIPSGVLNPLEVLGPSGGDPARVASSAARVPGVLTAAAPQDAAWRRTGSALVAVVPAGEPMSASGRRTMTDVRAAAAAAGAVTGGSGVPELDLVRGVYRAVPAALVVMALLVFAVTARLRSARTALGAVLRGLVAPVAVSGLLVLVWQYGLGARLCGGAGATGAVTGWVPLVAGAFAFLVTVDRAAAPGPADRSRPGTGLLVALPLLAIGLGTQVELALLATGVGGAALLPSALLRGPLLGSGRARRNGPEKNTEPTTSALPATQAPFYWSRPRSCPSHTIPLAEPSDHAQ
ncbi:MMPL family transporter [Streptomyces sp. NBC_00083]|uniref:MMPL family transporter n=1 Tax=Streptomyces sp. NBC_00083 TaxID=2975647 RepID=UPI00224EC092|nr:MMPL family transporter [Streptomyces sp. NBC_00083]MCX5385564.1 MMPL family transporter [Streptomyces sp. NBC_00083]